MAWDWTSCLMALKLPWVFYTHCDLVIKHQISSYSLKKVYEIGLCVTGEIYGLKGHIRNSRGWKQIPICFLVRNAPHSENHCEKTRFLMRLCCSSQKCWGWKRLKTTGIANVKIKEIPSHTHPSPTKGKVYFQHFHLYNFPYEGSKGTFYCFYI